MKQKLLTLVLLFSVFVLFGQNTMTVDELMKCKNGMEIYQKLIDSSIPNIEASRQNDFKSKAESLVAKSLFDARNYFTKKYNQKDIEAIYSELKQEDRISYSEKTSTFLKEWRLYKTTFQSDFKKMYNEFQGL